MVSPPVIPIKANCALSLKLFHGSRSNVISPGRPGRSVGQQSFVVVERFAGLTIGASRPVTGLVIPDPVDEMLVFGPS